MTFTTALFFKLIITLNLQITYFSNESHSSRHLQHLHSVFRNPSSLIHLTSNLHKYTKIFCFVRGEEYVLQLVQRTDFNGPVTASEKNDHDLNVTKQRITVFTLLEYEMHGLYHRICSQFPKCKRSYFLSKGENIPNLPHLGVQAFLDCPCYGRDTKKLLHNLNKRVGKEKPHVNPRAPSLPR